MSTTACRALALVLALGGCATIEHGTTQVLSVVPEPADAACVVTQGPNGPSLTPVEGRVELPRSALPLSVVCSKPGYREGKVLRPAMYSEKAFGGLSYLVDRSSGANYSYPPAVRVPLSPATP